ncbi:MerR family transcriptional regulator [Leifsonia sp. Leaf264]|uniref:MerR family transcriptional regulator n=1 Tax=Leifsonia sp. Leaf264 TaxID=1736314 RepID=UPI0007011736|nr:MerR family transcriptional regulator [Leifsonia sp. Leaf264]KQO99788.1 MerR family transcriptional regulator [Leifsonia sp. Leaf264]
METLEHTYSISEAAERTGLTAHTLRYYERTGLMLTPVDRASSTHRRFTEQDITWVSFLTKLRATSMPIARIRDYVVLVREGDDSTAARLELLLRHRITVVAQLAEMQRSLTAIDVKIAIYEEKVAHA